MTAREKIAITGQRCQRAVVEGSRSEIKGAYLVKKTTLTLRLVAMLIVYINTANGVIAQHWTYRIGDNVRVKETSRGYGFARNDSDDEYQFMICINKSMPNYDAIIDQIRNETKSDIVAEGILYDPFSGHITSINISLGDGIPLPLAKTIIRAVVNNAQDLPITITQRLDLYNIQTVSVGSFGPAETRPAPRDFLLILADESTTKERFDEMIGAQALSDAAELTPPLADGLIARYNFNGDGHDETGKSESFSTWRSYTNGSLCLNGSYKDSRNYGWAQLPGLNYTSLTCTVVFYAIDFRNDENSVLTFGHDYRWLSLRRNNSQFVEVSLNNFGVLLDFNTIKLRPQEWNVLTCTLALLSQG